MNCIDAVGFELLRREVNQVERHDGLCVADDRRSEHMSVIWIWKFQSNCNGLPVINHRTVERCVHQRQGSIQHRRIDLPLGDDISADLIKDRLRPQRLEELCFGEGEQGVSKDVRK